ncbi:hypothetical protein A0H76_1033 [Hepatospora eriocheir]|uniref:Uncharacterized protein n=1 Tax=Hepatospora eriocheir TaxID=1081669 RepID=A0A1X0Q683_9MICR|nr:hypothetical protein A0H76_1033 [Hepatospora eriocheir]
MITEIQNRFKNMQSQVSNNREKLVEKTHFGKNRLSKFKFKKNWAKIFGINKGVYSLDLKISKMIDFLNRKSLNPYIFNDFVYGVSTKNHLNLKEMINVCKRIQTYTLFVFNPFITLYLTEKEN